ncbi:MAG: endonuclease/exonuclease/phosphatase family protein, partial [Paracoccaceae bacterium]
LVAKFLKLADPDIMCLQETKCSDEKLPLETFEKLGYKFAAFKGQKSYNGVLILSKRKIVNIEKFNFCGKGDARHIGIELEDGIKVHNLYIPAGGDLPDIKLNPKFEHKINFLQK